MVLEIESQLHPLSLSQKNIWNLEKSIPGTSINNICTTIRIEGRLDFLLLQKSIHLLLKSDISLHTQLTLKDEEPCQYFVPYQEETLEVYDFSHTGEDGIHSWEEATTREVLPLLDAPLYRFYLFRAGENKGGVLIKVHHIISDGWSQVLICNRIAETYLKLLSGETPDMPEAPSYLLHVEEENEYLASRAYKKDLAYWKEMVEKSGESSSIKSVKTAAVSPVGRRLSFELPQVLNHAIYSFCQKNRVAPFAVFYMALAIYFKRIGGDRRFTIGVPIFNRTNFTFKQSTGMFVNTLPFFNEISDEWSLTEFNEQLMEAWFDLLRHQRFPFPHIARLAAEGNGSDGRLFQIALSYQDSKIYESPIASVHFSGRWHYGGYQAEQLCIHLSNMEDHRRYSVDYDYLSQFFSEQEIDDLHRRICNILEEALKYPDKPIHSLSVLTSEEREQVLYTFNQTTRYWEEGSLQSAYARIIRDYPSRAAVIQNGTRTSYQALAENAHAISVAVRRIIQEPNALVAVLLPKSPALFAAIAGILESGCAFLLISAEWPDRRILDVLESSGSAALLTDSSVCPKDLASRADLPVLFTGQLPEQEPDPAIEGGLKISDEDLAYVVYTSGSTGKPKGIEITRRSLFQFAMAMAPVYGKGAVLSVCSVGFDAFLIESAAAMLNGRTIVLAGEGEEESPRALAGLIRGYAVGFLSITPSRLSAMLKVPEFRSAMRLMESIVCGGEAFPSDLLGQLFACTHARIFNQYGPSEATIGVSLKLLNEAHRLTAGRPMPGRKLYVLDDWMNPLPIGVYGTLYIGGVCVGRGYRNAPELTAESFLENPFESGGRLYNTGDVACWTKEGEILLAGRKDRQVKLRGLRIEPQEVAACLASHPEVTEAAARVCLIQNQPVLTGYYCASGDVTVSELLTFLASYLPRYMVPAELIRLERLPLTANGKVDESRLPDPEPFAFPAGGRESSRLAGQILEIFSRILGQDELSCDSDYFLFGGNSLNAMETLGEVEALTEKRLRVTDLYACRTARRLAELLEKDGSEGKEAQESLSPAPKLDRYPLTPIQQGIYVQSFLDPTGYAYHMAGAFQLPESPDPERLQDAFRRLIAEDAIFRTAFAQDPDGIFAHVKESVSFDLGRLSAGCFDEAERAFLAPFDLAAPPLLHAALWDGGEEGCCLFLDIHHMIGDGMSTPVLLERLSACYAGTAAPSAALSYLDYAWASSRAEQAGNEKDKGYWKEHLTPLPSPFLLPADKPRPREFTFRGKAVFHAFSEELSKKCRAFCQDHGVSPYVLFLSAVGALLSAAARTTDFLIGTPVSGRRRPEYKKICGPFIDTMPVRLRPEKDLPLASYLAMIQDEVTGLLDHPGCSLEEMIEMFSLPRTVNQNPLYQTAFSMRPFEAVTLCFNGKPVQYRPVSTGTAKSDLSIEAAVEQGICQLRLEYADDLFTEETIAFYGRCIEQITAEIVKGKAKTIGELSLISPADRLRLIDRPNRSYYPFLNLPVHQLVKERAELFPEQAAVIFHGQEFTLGQIESQACGIAGLLTSCGITKGEAVGLICRRTPALFAAMLGILKAGAAYVPMLTNYPAARIKTITETAGIRRILCDSDSSAMLPEEVQELLLPLEQAKEGDFEDVPVSGQDPIHILFTSGSTGKPKGVRIPHRAVSNLYESVREMMEEPKAPVLCASQAIFDIFITESLLPLAMGKPVVLADEEEMLLPWKMAELAAANQIGYMQFTASRLQMCLGNHEFCRAASGLHFVIVGGEAVAPELVRKFKQVSSGRLVNLYGPTEATVYTTMIDLLPEEPVTIGRPMRNMRVYVMDEEQKPVLPTACGELYLAGAGIADGYEGQPDLTREAFLPDYYFPGEKMYRSGDLGRLRADGALDYLGRKDAQVKINGVRIELTEITSVMLQSGLAAQAAALPLKKPDGSAEICAFFEKTEERADGEAMKTKLRAMLPSHMMPSRIFALKKMPLTTTGKTDLQALKKLCSCPEVSPSPSVREERDPFPAAGDSLLPEEENQPSEPGEFLPDTPLQRTEEPPSSLSGQAPTVNALLSIWKETLGREDLSEEISFFEQGGSSLAALSVLSRYYNEHWEMTLGEFYQNPTAIAQASLLASGLKSAVSSGQAEEPDSAKTDAPYETPEAQPSSPSAKWPPQPIYPRFVPSSSGEISRRDGMILITGATGFFGSHLVKALLEQGAGPICCLVRGGKEALLDALTWYFGRGWAMQAIHCIHVATGNIALPNLGLSETDRRFLSGRTALIYHCAADVRHYTESSILQRTNTEGTKNVVRLALEEGAGLHYMSTASISGEYLVDAPDSSAVFTEHDFQIGQNWSENVYVKSKFLAEAEIYRALKQGLHAKVFRLGRLVGRDADGVFQKNPDSNAFYLMLRAGIRLGALPLSLADTGIDLTPVDICAEAAVALSRSEATTYHLVSPQEISLRRITEIIAPQVMILEDAVFSERLEAALRQDDRQILAPLVEFWNRARQKPVRISVSAQKTHQALKELGFIWPSPSPARLLSGFTHPFNEVN